MISFNLVFMLGSASLLLALAPIPSTKIQESPFWGWEGEGLMLIICSVNLISLLPALYPVSSKGEITLFAALVVVSVSILSNKGNSLLGSSTPYSTPLPLISFLNLIEVVSKGIRPLTLGVRLSANMSAGHLLMEMITPLFFLEVGVSLVQGYIFSSLSMLYLSEWASSFSNASLVKSS